MFSKVAVTPHQQATVAKMKIINAAIIGESSVPRKRHSLQVLAPQILPKELQRLQRRASAGFRLEWRSGGLVYAMPGCVRVCLPLTTRLYERGLSSRAALSCPARIGSALRSSRLLRELGRPRRLRAPRRQCGDSRNAVSHRTRLSKFNSRCGSRLRARPILSRRRRIRRGQKSRRFRYFGIDNADQAPKSKTLPPVGRQSLKLSGGMAIDVFRSHEHPSSRVVPSPYQCPQTRLARETVER